MSSVNSAAAFPRDAFDDFMDEAAALYDGDWFNGKVAGITYRNPDGSDRQQLARGLAERTELQLEPEPDNPYDEHAIKVLTPAGAQLGYLEGRLAGELSGRMAKGIQVRCYFRALREAKGVCGVSFGLLQYTTD